MGSNALTIDRPRAGGADAAIDSLADVLSDRLRLDEGRVREIAAEEVERLNPPARYEIRLEGGKATKVVGSGVTPHKQFGEILGLAEEGHRNIFLVGPAGSCKSTMAEHLAEALDLPAGMLSLSQGVTESHLLGRTLPQADGSWQSLFFRKSGRPNLSRSDPDPVATPYRAAFVIPKKRRSLLLCVLSLDNVRRCNPKTAATVARRNRSSLEVTQ